MGPSGLVARQPPLTHHMPADPKVSFFLHMIQQVDLSF